MSKEPSEKKVVKEMHKHGRKATDAIDLAAALSQYLLPTIRNRENWLGHEDPDAKKKNIMSYVEQHIPKVPKQVKDFLTEPSLNPLDYMRRAYSVVDIVDHLVGSRAHPERLPLQSPWTKLLEKLQLEGRYNSVDLSQGTVIPARYAPDVPELPPSRIGRRLCFIKPTPPYRIRYRYISCLDKLTDKKWQIAVIPAPFNPCSASHQPSPNIKKPHYEIRHSYTDKERDEFCVILDEINKSRDVPIAIFPEAALDQSTFLKLHNKFIELSSVKFARRGPGLQMVLLGHCGGDTNDFGGFNCITVLRKGGELAWNQAKINSYDLKNATIRRNNLALSLLPSEDEVYHERLDLTTSPEVTVADTPYGRFMIAICEDLSHLEPSIQIAVQAGVTHLIVPVLDRELKKGFWYHQKAQFLASEPGCITIVANSAFLERHVRSQQNNASNKTSKSKSSKSPLIDDPVAVLLINNHHFNNPRFAKWKPKSSKRWVKKQVSSMSS